MKKSISNAELEAWRTAFWKAKEIVTDVCVDQKIKDNSSNLSSMATIAATIVNLEATGRYETTIKKIYKELSEE
jgi:hypothetical protein